MPVAREPAPEFTRLIESPAGYLTRDDWALRAAHRAHVELEPDLEAPAHARRFLAGQLADTLDLPGLGVLQLAVSELVNNAVQHGAAHGDGNVVVHVAIAEDIVRVEVCDPGGGFSPPPAPPGGLEGGWGLRLVDQLVECWGVAPDDPRCVWVEVGTSGE